MEIVTMANKDLKYFMRDRKDEIVSVAGPDTFKDENGNVWAGVSY